MNQLVTIGVGALLLGGVGGFVIGNSSSDATQEGDELPARASAKYRGSQGSNLAEDRSPKIRAENVRAIVREPRQTARMQALIALYEGMDSQQLAEAADGLDGLSMRDRMMATMLLFSRWAEVDPLAAMEYSKGMGFAGGFAKPTILSSWASVDPVNAAKYYDENPREFATPGRGRGRGPGRADGAEVVATEWAKLDPSAALEWATSLDGRGEGGAVLSVIGEMAATDPAGAIAAVATLDEGSQGRAYAEIAERWANSDFEAADAWVQTLSGDAKQRALGELISEQADRDAMAAAARVSELDPGESRDRAVRDVATEWSKADPAEAAGWLASQESGESAETMRRVMGNWVAQDPVAAREFIEAQPAGDLRDGATQSFLRMTDLEPMEAMQLASGMSDERDRSRAIGGTAYRWLQDDPTAARNFIEGSDAIPESIKERLLQE